jgi:hypothetical protein
MTADDSYEKTGPVITHRRYKIVVAGVDDPFFCSPAVMDRRYSVTRKFLCAA